MRSIRAFLEVAIYRVNYLCRYIYVSFRFGSSSCLQSKWSSRRTRRIWAAQVVLPELIKQASILDVGVFKPCLYERCSCNLASKAWAFTNAWRSGMIKWFSVNVSQTITRSTTGIAAAEAMSAATSSFLGSSASALTRYLAHLYLLFVNIDVLIFVFIINKEETISWHAKPLGIWLHQHYGLFVEFFSWLHGCLVE